MRSIWSKGLRQACKRPVCSCVRACGGLGHGIGTWLDSREVAIMPCATFGNSLFQQPSLDIMQIYIFYHYKALARSIAYISCNFFSAKWHHTPLREWATLQATADVSHAALCHSQPSPILLLCGYCVSGASAVRGDVPCQGHWHLCHAIWWGPGVHNAWVSKLVL
jgi:hypothetical protein